MIILFSIFLSIKNSSCEEIFFNQFGINSFTLHQVIELINIYILQEELWEFLYTDIVANKRHSFLYFLINHEDYSSFFIKFLIFSLTSSLSTLVLLFILFINHRLILIFQYFHLLSRLNDF